MERRPCKYWNKIMLPYAFEPYVNLIHNVHSLGIYDCYVSKIISSLRYRFMTLFSITEPFQTPLQWVNVFIKAKLHNTSFKSVIHKMNLFAMDIRIAAYKTKQNKNKTSSWNSNLRYSALVGLGVESFDKCISTCSPFYVDS